MAPDSYDFAITYLFKFIYLYFFSIYLLDIFYYFGCKLLIIHEINKICCKQMSLNWKVIFCLIKYYNIRHLCIKILSFKSSRFIEELIEGETFKFFSLYKTSGWLLKIKQMCSTAVNKGQYCTLLEIWDQSRKDPLIPSLNCILNMVFMLSCVWCLKLWTNMLT